MSKQATGKSESVHPLSFSRSDQQRLVILSLGGRGWKLVQVDWRRHIAHVEPAADAGRSRWLGSSLALSAELCAAIRRVLAGRDADSLWSKRATEPAAVRATEAPPAWDFSPQATDLLKFSDLLPPDLLRELLLARFADLACARRLLQIIATY